MKRLLPRLPRRRAPAPPLAEPHTAEAPNAIAAPAGAPDPSASASGDLVRPSYRDRGRARRRLRFLRRVRELGLRDLGGLVFDQHRFDRVSEELVRGKLDALRAVDAELRVLEHALDDRQPITELREPGISACPRCGTLHGSDARFCPSCGASIRGPRTIADVGEGQHPSPAPSPPVAVPQLVPSAPASANASGGADQSTAAVRPAPDAPAP